MNDENNSIIYPQEDPEEWAKRYSITVRSNPCLNCGKILTPTKPYAHGRWRGLISEPHGCKDDFDLSIVTKATPEERREIGAYFNFIAEALKNDEDEEIEG